LGEIAKSCDNFNVKVSDSHVKVNTNVIVLGRNSHGTGQSNVKVSIKSPMLAFIKEIYKLQAKLNGNIGTYSVTCLTQTSLEPAAVIRCSVYTDEINKDYIHLDFI